MPGAAAAPGAFIAPIAMVLTNQPEAVALFFALSALPAPVILLPADPRGWRSSPSVPAGTRLVLFPRLAPLAPEAVRLDLVPMVLAEPGSASSEAPTDPPFFSAPGFVVLTSGSTELPRPVYRTTASLLASGASVVEALRLPAGGGVVGALPIARGYGLVHALLSATLLGGPLGLLPRFDPHGLFALCASGRYCYWPGTPVMADLLQRCPWPEPPPALPEFCVVASHVSHALSEAFQRRFGVPLRQTYGTTETGPVTLDHAASADVRSDTAGRVLPGVTVGIGDDPREPVPRGELGRVWVATPRYMEGYGFPPNLARPASRDGWWPTQDVGRLDGSDGLTLVGRVDDCVRTSTGYLVNPVEVAVTFEDHPGVTDVAVVPLETAAGAAVGVLVEGGADVTIESLHRHLASRLPLWSRPRVLEVIEALPRLPGGKTDRLACIGILTGLLSEGGAPPVGPARTGDPEKAPERSAWESPPAPDPRRAPSPVSDSGVPSTTRPRSA